MALTQEQIDKNTAIFASQGRNPDGSPKTPFIGSIQTTNAGGQPGLLQYGETQMNPSGIGTRQELFTPGARGGVETKDTISTPTTTLNIPSSPSVISSDTAQRGIIDPLQAQIDAAKARARESEAGIQQLDMASMERARQQAQIRRQEEEKQQKEELLTQKAGQFRFGQAGTQYADIATQKLKETQANQLRAMDLQFQDLVDQSQKYLLQGDLRKASQLMEDAQQIQNKQFQMRQEARQAEAAVFENQIKALTARKLTREEDEAIGQSVAPQLFKDLEVDPNANYNDLVIKYSNAYGVDPIKLSGAIIKYKNEREKESILNNKNNVDYLQTVSTVSGKSFETTLPGIGKVTINPKQDTTLIEGASGSLYSYDKNTQKVTLLPVKKEQFGLDKIFDAFKFIAEGKDTTGVISQFLTRQNVEVPGAGSISFRNNNPLNIKFGDFAKSYGATQGTQATDGGVFAKFPSIEAGEKAAKDLLASSTYSNLPLEQAMRKWSGGGYGSDVAPELKNKTISQMNQTEVDLLFNKMKQREGWTPSTQPLTDNSANKIAQDIFDGVSSLDVKSLPTARRIEVDKELNKLKRDAISKGNFEGVMRASAGGSEVGDTFLQSFDKGLNVIQQIGDLQTSIKKEATGPILGIIRSKNPYDTKAQLIKAQLAAIVPNLARGVYGEVGVLTDNDIANYTKTLPNLKSTEEVSNLLLGITVRTVQRSLENKLRTQANGGKDVSGFIDTYKQIKQTANSLLPVDILAKEKGFSDKELQDARNLYSDEQIKQLLIK